MTEAGCHWNSRGGRKGALCVMKPGVSPWEREILETLSSVQGILGGERAPHLGWSLQSLVRAFGQAVRRFWCPGRWYAHTSCRAL